MIGFVTHLNGAVATVLLCTLVFVDEVGVPLPFAPNEILMLVTGLLIASGVLLPFVVLPAIAVFMTAGMLTGFAWSRKLGSERLRRAAERLDAERAFARAVRRVRGASAGGLLLARLLPGVRIYATLAAGASGTRRARFLTAAMPALAIWIGVLVLVGDLAGRPAEHLLSRVDTVVLAGVLLLVLGGAAFMTLRHVPHARDADDDHLSGVPRGARLALALAVDLGVAGCLVAGGVGLGGHFVALLHQPVGAAFLATVIVVGYIVASRRGAGSTLGEGLVGVDLRSALRRGRHRRTQRHLVGRGRRRGRRAGAATASHRGQRSGSAGAGRTSRR